VVTQRVDWQAVTGMADATALKKESSDKSEHSKKETPAFRPGLLYLKLKPSRSV
jgi:hypothetical protein